MTEEDEDRDRLLREVAETLTRRSALTDAAAATEAAREWIAKGFDDAEEVAEWLDAGCGTAAEARRLDDAGITPGQAALRTTDGPGGAEDTLARKLARGELSLAEVRRHITREFWRD